MAVCIMTGIIAVSLLILCRPRPRVFGMDHILQAAIKNRRMVIIYVDSHLAPLGGIVDSVDRDSITLLYYEGPSNDPLSPLVINRDAVVAIEWMSEKNGQWAEHIALHNKFRAVMDRLK